MRTPGTESATEPATEPESSPVWRVLLAAAASARRPDTLEPGRSYGFSPEAIFGVVSEASPQAWLLWQPPWGWVAAAAAPPAMRSLLDLYLPVCSVSASTPLTVGHLGQGLDGYIATQTGDSHYVTGPENILHLHRMRALCDAVVVGAGTVAADDPRLTARRADGSNPVRVVLDPQRRLASTHRVFTDPVAPTLLVCADAAAHGAATGMSEHVEVLHVPVGPMGLDLEALLAALHARALYAVFVEGGGKTVSAFLAQGLLDRLQIAIAPLVTGAGRPGLQLEGKARMHECLRLSPRIFAMGQDVLFDCALGSSSRAALHDAPARTELGRIV